MSTPNFYAARGARKDGKHKTLRMHRELIDCPDGLVIDHIDRNGLNNQKSNLRTCTPQQNQQNCANRNDGKTSTYKGVWRQKQTGRFYASLFVEKGKRLYFGGFTTDREAAIAYNEAAKKYHGEFAYLNEITED